MSYAVPRPVPRPYGTRPSVGRPYSVRPYGVTPVPVGGGIGAGVLGGTLGAIGGTLGCLLCLSAIGALGLFSCVVAITAYAKQFLNAYKTAASINGASEVQIGFVVLLASLFYTIICRIQRS